VRHWTKRNFDDLADRSPAEVPMCWRFSRNAIHSSQVGVSRAFEAGPVGPRLTQALSRSSVSVGALRGRPS
jgi:hypothetical protein